MAAVAPFRVDMEVALDILDGNKLRQFTISRRLYLAPVFSHFRRHILQAEYFINILFLFSAEFLVVMHPKNSVLVDREPSLHRHLAQANVVLLAAGKVNECRAIRFFLNYSQVHLKSFRNDDARLGRAMHEDILHLRKLYEDLHHFFRIVGHGKDVDILYGIFPSSQASGDIDSRERCRFS